MTGAAEVDENSDHAGNVDSKGSATFLQADKMAVRSVRSTSASLKPSCASSNDSHSSAMNSAGTALLGLGDVASRRGESELAGRLWSEAVDALESAGVSATWTLCGLV